MKALLLCALVLGTGTAQAAPGWLPPQDLSAPGQYAYSPQVALDGAGNALAIWTRATAQAAVHPPGAGWQVTQNLSADRVVFTPQVAFDAAGNAVAVWIRYADDGVTYLVEAAVRPVGGAWQAPQILSAAGSSALNPQVALDAAGNAVAVWSRSNGANDIVQATVRPAASGIWQPAQDLSASGQNASYPQVALDAAGNAVVVWQRYNGTHHIVQAAVRPAGGVWQAAQGLSALGQTAAYPQVGLDAVGNALAVWQRSNGTNFIVQAAYRPAGGAWQAAQDLSATGQNASDPQVALDPPGNAVAVWTRSNGMNSIVQAAVRAAGGPWQLPAQNLSAAGQTAISPQIAVDPGGNAIAVWQRHNGTNFIAQAAVRPAASGGWQPAQDLSAAGGDAGFSQIAVDPAGNAVAVWQRYQGPHGIIQAAPYDATAPVLRSVDVPARGFARQRLSFSVDPFDAWSPLGLPVWSFGDGTSTSGRTVTHTYAKRGTYTVSVTQADAVANVSTATRPLTVRTARCFGSPASKVGSSGNDRIRGTRRADVIVSLGGADRIRGRGGNDRICGGAGRDRIAGGAGNDRINGGPGRDICSQGGGRGRLVAC